MAAARRPPASLLEIVRNAPVSYLPRVEKLNDRYRLTLQMPEPLPHYLVEKTSEKIWLRLVRPAADGSQVLEGDNVIREVRLISHAYSADMILKMGSDAVSNDVYFDDGKKKLVVDVFTKKRQHRLVQTPTKSMAPLPAKKGRTFTIVVDAGHGGMDCGAIGTRGTMEKDINLAAAKALAQQLSKERNIRVLMTRHNDEFIALNQRTEIANAAGADLFVSVHCNSSLSPKNVGFETYYLSPDATDKAAESVARLENSVVALEAQKGAPSSRLSEVLASMAVGNFLNESSKFAALVCRNIRSHTSEDKADVKEADFFVLRGAQMPSILIELEYLSNPISELKLRSSRYRSQLVKGVAEGIKAYERQAKYEQEAMASQTREALNLNPR